MRALAPALSRQIAEILAGSFPDREKAQDLAGLMERYAEYRVAEYKKHALEDGWSRGERLTLPPVARAYRGTAEEG